MLYIVATPIGNLEDISARAIKVLQKADIIACEDTRRTSLLIAHFGLGSARRLMSYREQTETKAGEQIVEHIERGMTVALCSDGGMPGISDPGYRLVRAAIDRGISVEVIPGASAVQVALVLSGLPTSSYTFKGFPPRKPTAMRRFFEEEQSQTHTLVIFESPFRVVGTLNVALGVLGDRQAAVCIEMTKKFEKVRRGFLSALSTELASAKIRGEVTIVIAGNHPKFIQPADVSDA